MHLNADIIYEGLASHFNSLIFGPRTPELRLHRPVLLTDAETVLRRNRLYVAALGDVAPRLKVEDDACLVCVGGSTPPVAYKEHCCVITVDQRRDDVQGAASVAEVFNAIQRQFDHFDEWTEDLGLMVEGDANIQAMLERSEAIFQNPLLVIDANFSLLGACGFSEDDGMFSQSESFEGANLNPSAFQKFLKASELSMREPEPFFVTVLDQSTLNFDLLADEDYLGCLTLCYAFRGHRASDKPLIAHLGSFIQRAIIRSLPSRTTSVTGALAQALRRLIDGTPLEPVDELALQSSQGRVYLCALLTLDRRLDQLPLGYVCNTIAASLSHSIALEYDEASVVAFVDVATARSFDEGADAAASELLEPFVRSFKVTIGLSDPIEDLAKAPSYLRQAQMAVNIGSLLDPHLKLYRFQHYGLTAMLIAATSSLPVEFLETPGLRRLIAHDAHSDTSYVETLRVLLDENMNITKTAARLYVHRSTLLERLARIRRDLDGELDTPEGRLRLRMLLATMDIQGTLSDAPHP